MHIVMGSNGVLLDMFLYGLISITFEQSCGTVLGLSKLLNKYQYKFI